MKLRTRILLALGLMTVLIGALAVASAFVVKRLGTASENIIKDNFISIEAANYMTDALDEMDNAVSHRLFAPKTRALDYRATYARNDSMFRKYLSVAESNVTEPGERDILQALHSRYNEYTQKASADSLTYASYLVDLAQHYESLKASCIALLEVNKKGVYLRNERAKRVAAEAILYTILLAIGALVIAIIMLVRFPRLVIHPITELTSKIKAVANRKYSERIEYAAHDEIGELATSFNQMATKLDEYERSNIEAVITVKKRSEAIVGSMSDPVIVLSDDWSIVLVNAVASGLLGVTEEDILGKDARVVAKTNNLLAELIKDIEIPTARITADKGYLRIYNNGKEEFYLKDVIRINRTKEETGTPLGYIIELKNISEFKALDEAKSGFVTTVSHELRTPLSALNMSIRLLQDERVGSLNTEQSHLLEAMKFEVRRLLRIVSELLELSRAEIGAELMHMESVTAENIVDAAVTPMMLQAAQKQVTLDIHLPSELPFVRADSSKISWVLINLLSNAIRFTPPGGIVRLLVSEKNATVEFVVSDTGVGIEPPYLDRIFDKFFQVDLNKTDQHSGVGLGLAISKEIVEAHGGKIWVNSEVGKGSTFGFSLRSA
ncbi:MAG: HAMP domain-containing protein [Bacteroidetes bacterium]|nr:HAMP domain-containing protein [Bacteroidota bacterium]